MKTNLFSLQKSSEHKRGLNIHWAFLFMLMVTSFVLYLPGNAQNIRKGPIWLLVSDDAAARDTSRLWFGNFPNATYPRPDSIYFPGIVTGSDTIYEKFAPPFPPGFGAYWYNITGRTNTWDQGLLTYDFRGFPTNVTRKDTFRVKIQGDNSAADMKFKWPDAATLRKTCDSMKCIYSGGSLVNMFNIDSVVIVDAGDLGVQYLTIYKWGRVNQDLPALAASYPQDNETGIDTNVTIKWRSATGAWYYFIQVSADSTFKSVLSRATLSDTAYSLTRLSGSKTYYWRVYYENDNGTSVYQSPPFRFTTRVLMSPPKQLYPDSSATNIPTSFTMRWNAINNGLTVSYHVQIALDSLFSSITKDTTVTDTALAISGLQNCNSYYWRINAASTMGTSSWSNAWRFKIIPATPAAPALSSPADNATGQSLTPTLSWTAGDICNYSYRLEVATDAGFTNRVAGISTTQTSATLSQLSQLTDYYWHVKAFNTADSGAFSTARKFTTLLLPPSTPTQLVPTNGDSTVTPIATIRWRSTALTTNYHLQLSTSSSFATTIVNDSTLTDTSYVTSALSNCVTYYWRIQSKNAAGISSWSTGWSFKITPATPAVPSLTLPADNAVNVPLSTTLSWSGDVCSYRYHLQVAKDTAFTNLVLNTVLSSASSPITFTEQNQLFYWRVKAVNQFDSSAYTPYRTFRTILNPPGVPTLVTPASGDTNFAVNGSLIWRTVPYAETYRLQIATDGAFANLLLNDSTLVDTAYAPSFLLNCKTYYWRVLAKNVAGWSAYSSIWNFKVRTALADPPTLVYPPNNQDSLSENVILRWNKGSICTQWYRYEISRNNTFTDIVTSGQTTDTTMQITSLAGNVYYYWHVMSVNYLGSSVASSTFQFHTTVAKPEQPVLLSPANGTTGLLNTVTLQWDSAAFSKSYKLQVALDTGFTNLKVYDSSIVRESGVRPSRIVTGLLNSTTYYWRAVGKNELGNGPWSSRWSFTTLYPPAAPILNLPNNGQTNVALTPLFDWNLAQRANIYELIVAKDPSFTKVVFNDSTITELSKQIGTVLKEHTVYYWRVRGKNDVGWGTWSSVNNFVTKYVTPAEWLIPLTVKETGPAYSTIYFGIAPGATRGIDTAFEEYALPPVDPWYFDARFESPYIGDGLLVDVLPFNDYAQVDTFQFSFQPGLGTYPIQVSWSQSLVNTVCDSMVMKDILSNPTLHVRMDQDSAITVSNSGTRSLYIVSYGPVPLLGVKPIKPNLPRGYVLYQNYPNPFNPTTHISFSLDQSSSVKLTIYDMLGRELVTIADQNFIAGTHTFEWNGKDRSGTSVPSGVYYLRMIAVGTGVNAGTQPPFVSARKMIMLK
jgi:hypothetical protein